MVGYGCGHREGKAHHLNARGDRQMGSRTRTHADARTLARMRTHPAYLRRRGAAKWSSGKDTYERIKTPAIGSRLCDADCASHLTIGRVRLPGPLCLIPYFAHLGRYHVLKRMQSQRLCNAVCCARRSSSFLSPLPVKTWEGLLCLFLIVLLLLERLTCSEFFRNVAVCLRLIC